MHTETRNTIMSGRSNYSIGGYQTTSEFHGIASDRKCVKTLSDNTGKQNTALGTSDHIGVS